MTVSYSKSTKIDDIVAKLQRLSDEELEHANQFLDALFSNDEQPFDHYLAKFLEVEKAEQGYKMKLGKQTENTYGVAQGGAVFTLADVAIGFHLIENLPKEVKVFTLELKMNFIKGGSGDYLLATPVVLHQGRTTAVAECEIRNDQNEMVAKAFGTFYLKR